MNPDLYKAPQEKAAPELLEKHFHLIQTNLPIADYWNHTLINQSCIMVESKIGTDGTNLPQFMDELTRMNYAEYQAAIRHAVWLWNLTMQRKHLEHTGWHNITTKIVQEQYEKFCDRFRSLCISANVYPHIVKTKAKYVSKMKSIFEGAYDQPLQVHKQPSKKLSELAQVMSLSKGTTEKTAIDTATKLTKTDIYNVFGLKKDGTPQKKALDLIKYLARLYTQIKPILES